MEARALNKGQWPQQVRFRAEIPGGALFLEKQGLTYHFQKSNHKGHQHGTNDNLS